MTNINNHNPRQLVCVAALFAVFASGAAAAQQQSPAYWLERMARAADSLDYEGTVIRRQHGEAEALKVVRKIIDGVVNERVSAQEGDGIEIIRVGGEVHCILPGKKSVLVEAWNSQSAIFSALPRSDVSDTPQYDLSLVRKGRVAGRPAILLAVRPHDQYRYAHRIWIDTETALPLQTELLDVDGGLVQEVKFADITIGDGIRAQDLDPSVNLEGFTWYREPAPRYRNVDVEASWVSEDLPAGFRVVSTSTEIATDEDAADSGGQRTHILYSDGIASVSVFIEPASGDDRPGWAVLGASNSYSVAADGYQITAVGEVPAITVQRIAVSMRQQ